MNKIYASEFDQNQHPIRVGYGSPMPGEILKRAWIAMRRKIQSEEKPIAQPIRIHRGYFGENHDYSEAYTDRLFSRWVGEPDGHIIFDIGASGNPEITVNCLSGEVIYDESILTSFTGSDIKTIKRCDNAIGISTSGALSTVSFGVVSLFTDMIPLWAEVSAIVGLASVAVQQRVRCLIEFKSDDEPTECESADETEGKKQPFIIADLPEIAFIMLDACLHEPLWQPLPVAPVHEQDTSKESVGGS